MYRTLELADNRLPQKEQIWGLDLNAEQVALARSFFTDPLVYNTTDWESNHRVALLPRQTGL